MKRIKIKHPETWAVNRFRSQLENNTLIGSEYLPIKSISQTRLKAIFVANGALFWVYQNVWTTPALLNTHTSGDFAAIVTSSQLTGFTGEIFQQ